MRVELAASRESLASLAAELESTKVELVHAKSVNNTFRSEAMDSMTRISELSVLLATAEDKLAQEVSKNADLASLVDVRHVCSVLCHRLTLRCGWQSLKVEVVTVSSSLQAEIRTMSASLEASDAQRDAATEQVALLESKLVSADRVNAGLVEEMQVCVVCG